MKTSITLIAWIAGTVDDEPGVRAILATATIEGDLKWLALKPGQKVIGELPTYIQRIQMNTEEQTMLQALPEREDALP